MNMTFLRDEDKPWKTNLARQSALRRQRVREELETVIKKAGSFEEALHNSAELMKKRFARFSAITAYVADGEDLVVHTSLDRPEGPDRVWSGGGPLAEAAKADKTTLVSDVSDKSEWADVGLSSGSAMVTPVRTDAGLWAILEVWSDFRSAFTTQDVELLDAVVAALAKKTPAA